MHRTYLYIFLSIALLSAVAVVAVLYEANRSNERLLDSGPGGFNHLLQFDYQLERFQNGLRTALEASDKQTASIADTESSANWQRVRTFFDLLWSAHHVFTIREPGSSEQLLASRVFKAEFGEFLADNDTHFSQDTMPDDRRALVSALEQSYMFNAELHSLSLTLRDRHAKFRDQITRDSQKLLTYLELFGLLLAASWIIVVAILLRAMKRADRAIAEMDIAQQKLEVAISELRSGKREKKEKDSFLAAASHDLRQPLHALGLFVSALEKHVSGVDGNLILVKIRQSQAALNKLLNSLLDISKLDAGIVDIDKRHFVLADIFNNVREEYQEVGAARSIELYISDCDQIAYSDPVLLTRILKNLIENAISHSGTPKVELNCSRVRGELELQIRDFGSGIALDEQDQVFSEFYQLNNPERDRSKGLGLGLSIVKRLCDLLEMPLRFESELGEGTVFSVCVPIGNRQLVEESQDDSVDGRFLFEGVTVLVIDDDQDVRDGMELVLRDTHCDVIACEDGEQALDHIVEQDIVPTVLVVDYRLRNNRTGIEAIEAIWHELNVDVPAIVISGDTSPERVREVADSGMRLLHKPVEPTELLHEIRLLLFTDSASLPDSDAEYPGVHTSH